MFWELLAELHALNQLERKALRGLEIFDGFRDLPQIDSNVVKTADWHHFYEINFRIMQPRIAATNIHVKLQNGKSRSDWLKGPSKHDYFATPILCQKITYISVSSKTVEAVFLPRLNGCSVANLIPRMFETSH